MKSFNFRLNINLSWLKMIATIVVLVGCFGFMYGLVNKIYVTESVGVISLGLATLAGRKYLISKDKDNGDIQQ